jgi:hypothetical protein
MTRYLMTVSGDAAEHFDQTGPQVPKDLADGQKTIEQSWVNFGEIFAEGWWGALVWETPTRAVGKYGMQPDGREGTAVFELHEAAQ